MAIALKTSFTLLITNTAAIKSCLLSHYASVCSLHSRKVAVVTAELDLCDKDQVGTVYMYVHLQYVRLHVKKIIVGEMQAKSSTGSRYSQDHIPGKSFTPDNMTYNKVELDTLHMFSGTEYLHLPDVQMALALCPS